MNFEFPAIRFADTFKVSQRNGLTKPKSVRGAGLPMVNMGELFAHPRIRDIDMDKVPVSEKEKVALLQPNDLLFARQSLVLAGAGQCSIFLGHRPTVFESHLIRCRLDEEMYEPKYYYYFFKSSLGRAAIRCIVEQGAAASGIKGSDLIELEVPAPPFPTQKLIANFFDNLDKEIENLHHQNTALEAIAQRLFRSWFVNFDPVHAKAAGKEPEGMSAELAALFPSEFEDSELGPIPKGWSVTTFGDAFDIKGGATPSTSEPLYWHGGTHAWATPKDMSSLASKVMYRTERQITAAGVAKISSKALPSGTVLMSSRAPVGYLAIAKAPISINQGFIAIPPTPGIPASFAVELLAYKMPDIKANAGGTTFAEISKTQFRPIKWTRPSDKVLAAFGKLVEPLYAQVHGNCLLVDSLASLRDHLLPRLISGKLSLEEAERVVEEAVAVEL